MTRGTRTVLGFVDQGLSSASNVFMLLAVARTSSVAAFGAVAVTVMFLSAALAIGRGSFGTPLLLASNLSREGLTKELAGAQTGSAGLGLLCGAGMVVTGLAEGVFSSALVLAIAAPVVLVQDAHRFAALARDDQLGAVIWDGVWAFGALGLLALTWVRSGWINGVEVLLAWGVLAALSLAGLAIRARSWPLWWGWRRWWEESRQHRVRFGVEGAIGALSSLVVVTTAIAMIGASAAAALRGAGTLLGPLSLFMSALPLAVVPGAVRSLSTLQETWRSLRKVAAAMSVVALAIGSLGMVLPRELGELALGASWTVVAPLLPITGLEYAALAWISVLYVTLRSANRSKPLLNLRLFHASVSLIMAVSAAAIWSTASSVAWGLAMAATVVAVTGPRVVLRPS